MFQKGFELLDLALKGTMFILCKTGPSEWASRPVETAMYTHLFAVSRGSTPQPVAPQPHTPSRLSSAEG